MRLDGFGGFGFGERYGTFAVSGFKLRAVASVLNLGQRAKFAGNDVFLFEDGEAGCGVHGSYSGGKS